MKYNIPEEQLLTYVHGEHSAKVILEGDYSDHYRSALKKLNTDQSFVWNWTAFFFGALWLAGKRVFHPYFILGAAGLIVWTVMVALFQMEQVIALSTDINGLADAFFRLTLIMSCSKFYVIAAAFLVIHVLVGLLGDRWLIEHLSNHYQKGNLEFLPKAGIKFIIAILTGLYLPLYKMFTTNDAAYIEQLVGERTLALYFFTLFFIMPLVANLYIKCKIWFGRKTALKIRDDTEK